MANTIPYANEELVWLFIFEKWLFAPFPSPLHSSKSSTEKKFLVCSFHLSLGFFPSVFPFLPFYRFWALRPSIRVMSQANQQRNKLLGGCSNNFEHLYRSLLDFPLTTHSGGDNFSGSTKLGKHVQLICPLQEMESRKSWCISPLLWVLQHNQICGDRKELNMLDPFWYFPCLNCNCNQGQDAFLLRRCLFFRELNRFLEFSFLMYFVIIFKDWFKSRSSHEHFHALNFSVWDSFKQFALNKYFFSFSSSFIQEISDLSNYLYTHFFPSLATSQVSYLLPNTHFPLRDIFHSLVHFLDMLLWF